MKHAVLLQRFFLSIQPKVSAIYVSSITQCSQLVFIDNGQSGFNLALTELKSNNNERFLLKCILNVFIVRQKFISWCIPIATAYYIRFFHHQYQKLITDKSP